MARSMTWALVVESQPSRIASPTGASTGFGGRVGQADHGGAGALVATAGVGQEVLGRGPPRGLDCPGGFELADHSELEGIQGRLQRFELGDEVHQLAALVCRPQRVGQFGDLSAQPGNLVRRGCWTGSTYRIQPATTDSFDSEFESVDNKILGKPGPSPPCQNQAVSEATAGAYADAWVAHVRDDPRGRLALLCRLYSVPPAVDRGYLPYRRAASAFMGWQLRRGLLNPESDRVPGSPWWRAVNEALLRDTCEASAIAFGRPGDPRTPGVAATLDFIREPTARTWYRAHNLSIASAFLSHVDLAAREGRVERFFINLVLIRVLYAHALVANPRLALDWLAPVSRAARRPAAGHDRHLPVARAGPAGPLPAWTTT